MLICPSKVGSAFTVGTIPTDCGAFSAFPSFLKLLEINDASAIEEAKAKITKAIPSMAVKFKFGFLKLRNRKGFTLLPVGLAMDFPFH